MTSELSQRKKEQHRQIFLSSDSSELYHVGIIDWLQLWDWHKKMEMAAKVVFKGKERRGLSARPPQEYAQRFYKFMMHSVFTANVDVLHRDIRGSLKI